MDTYNERLFDFPCSATFRRGEYHLAKRKPEKKNKIDTKNILLSTDKLIPDVKREKQTRYGNY